VGQKHEKFWEFRAPFPPRDICKNPRSMYARMPQVMAQFVLKIELLSHIMGTGQGGAEDSRNFRIGAASSNKR